MVHDDRLREPHARCGVLRAPTPGWLKYAGIYDDAGTSLVPGADRQTSQTCADFSGQLYLNYCSCFGFAPAELQLESVGSLLHLIRRGAVGVLDASQARLRPFRVALHKKMKRYFLR